MEKVEKAAKTANGRSRMCAKCPFNTKPKSRCTEEIYTLCSTSFVTGFRKGANWRKMENKKVKIALPKNCGVEKTEISVEDNFIIVEYTPRVKFEPKEGNIVFVQCFDIDKSEEVRDWINIFGREEHGDIYNHCSFYAGGCFGLYVGNNKDRRFAPLERIKEIRLATERERETLFDALKEKGLQWNKKEKRIEKIRWRASKMDGMMETIKGYKEFDKDLKCKEVNK